MNSNDDDEEETYVPPRKSLKGKEVASSAGEAAAESDDEETFDGEAAGVASGGAGGMQFGRLLMHAPNNPPWRAKVSYKGKTDLVREIRTKDPRPLPKEATDYRFHTYFQQDFYESVILSKNNPVAQA